MRIAEEWKERLALARGGKTAGPVRDVEAQMGELSDHEAGVLVDLLLSYRAVEAWEEMVELVEHLPRPVAETVLVQEQYAFALNRAGNGERAEEILLALIERRGPSSETYGLLGRVYKDRWQAARERDDVRLAAGLLEKAIDAYLRGFEADWRDAYPGINAVTLMEIAEPPDPRGVDLVPVVEYAAQRRVAAGHPDYWDHATLLEAAVLARDEAGCPHRPRPRPGRCPRGLGAEDDPAQPPPHPRNARAARRPAGMEP